MTDQPNLTQVTPSLYHYCNTQAFWSIVSNKTIWLSSLKLSNDTLEGRIVTQTVMRLAERDGLDPLFRERLRTSIVQMEDSIDGLGFCLSEEADLLSQWRGYADDAQGVSIGFSRAYLEQLRASYHMIDKPGFAMRKVAYDPKTHENLVEPTYLELRKLIDAGAFKQVGPRSLLDSRTETETAEENKFIESKQRDLFFKMLEFVPHLFELKSSAFSEEQEWRLVSILISYFPDECLHRSSRSRIIPYRSFELAQTDIPTISEVILGPKHQTPENVVKSMLQHSGFGTVPVRRSSASYR